MFGGLHLPVRWHLVRHYQGMRMGTRTHGPTVDVIELQQRTVKLLEMAEQLFQRAETSLSRPEQYRTIRKSIQAEHRKVTALELRMSIVAPMKAGKSTIVNAILGAGVLPTRNSAMTSLPTEIVDDPGRTEPQLTIPEATLSRMSELWQQIHRVVAQRGLDAVLGMVAEYPELRELLTGLAGRAASPFQATATGAQPVQAALLMMNDLCRLAPMLLDGRNPLISDDGFQSPRIHARFLRAASALDPSKCGALVIVDTPGPNEARQHRLLEKVVIEQLAETSLVLLVLDYTQLNTQAAELVGKEVQTVSKIVGIENVYVLVNKIDERDDKSMSEEQVRQFVSGHLGLKRPVAASRLFEVSAKRAFRAAEFIREYDRASSEARRDARSWAAATELAPIVFGATQWREDLDEASGEQLARRARSLWGMSGFDAFLTKAIERLLAEVAPRAVRVAVAVMRSHLTTLRNDSRLQHKAIRTDTALVEAELKNLDQEVRNLEEGRRHIDARLRDLEQDLRRHLEVLRRRLQPVIKEDVRRFFKENEEVADSFIARLIRSGKRAVASSLGDPLRGVSGTVEFDRRQDAQAFANDAIEFALDKIQPQIQSGIETTKRRFETTRKEFEGVLIAETAPILKRAADRIKRQFDVVLEFPRPRLSDPLDRVGLTRRVTKFRPAGVETRTRYERRWYTLFLWRHEVEYEVQVGEKYMVSLDDVALQVGLAVQQSVDGIATGFDDFIATEFKECVDGYFGGLRDYLRFYRQSLEEAVNAQRMSLEQRSAALVGLESIDGEATKHLEALDDLSAGMKVLFIGDEDDEDEEVSEAPGGVEVVVSYSHNDEPLRRELEKHLALLRREGLVRIWHDREILPGQSFAEEIDRHIESAGLVLLLVSSDFIDSDYCWAKEMTRALERQKSGAAQVVPIILRACEWQPAPFGGLQALPKGGQAVTSWADKDAAFADVAKELRRIVARLLAS